MPVNEQKMSVNQFMLRLIPVTNDIRFTANSEPIPDSDDTANNLIK